MSLVMTQGLTWHQVLQELYHPLRYNRTDLLNSPEALNFQLQMRHLIIRDFSDMTADIELFQNYRSAWYKFQTIIISIDWSCNTKICLLEANQKKYRLPQPDCAIAKPPIPWHLASQTDSGILGTRPLLGNTTLATEKQPPSLSNDDSRLLPQSIPPPTGFQSAGNAGDASAKLEKLVRAPATLHPVK